MRTFCFALLCIFAVCVAGPSDPIPTADLDAHSRFVQNTANNPDIPIIFYGDSITRRWVTDGLTVFQQYYESLGVANYGIGGELIQMVLWRILNGEIDGLNPKLVVLKIGTNNLDPDGNVEIAAGIQKLVSTFRQLLPNTKIILIGILPRNGVTYFDKIVAINNIIGNLHDGKNIYFLNMFDLFRTEVWGLVPDSLFNDGLHLTTAGYQLWAETMNPVIDEVISSSALRASSALTLQILSTICIFLCFVKINLKL